MANRRPAPLLVTWAALLLTLLCARPAHADNKFDLALPSHVYIDIVDGQTWWESTVPTEANEGLNPLLDGHFGDGVLLNLRLTVYCPDIDEKVEEMRFEDAHGVTKRVADEWHDAGMRVDFHLTKDRAALLAEPQYAWYTITWWCKPLVGKSEKISISSSVPLTVRVDPDDVPSHSRPSMWTHFCPSRYEVDQAVQYGYGQTEVDDHRMTAACREVDPALVKPKEGSKNKPKNDPETIDMEQYAWTLAKARAAVTTLNAAGLDTVYDLAKTDSANLTSVLGIAGGQAVRTSAVQAIASSSVIDPNWLFDEYYLIDPSWFVDPRIRGTHGAATQIEAAQTKLLKLQNAGIVTVGQLAGATATKVAPLLGVSVTDAKALIAAAKDKAVHQGNGRAMKIQPDWVLHPLWLIDPGYLPSVRVRRSQPAPTPAGPTVSVETPAKLDQIPPATKPPTMTKAPKGQAVPKILINPKRSSGSKKTGKGSRTTRGRAGRGGSGIPEAGRGSRGSSSGGRTGDGSSRGH